MFTFAQQQAQQQQQQQQQALRHQQQQPHPQLLRRQQEQLFRSDLVDPSEQHHYQHRQPPYNPDYEWNQEELESIQRQQRLVQQRHHQLQQQKEVAHQQVYAQQQGQQAQQHEEEKKRAILAQQQNQRKHSHTHQYHTPARTTSEALHRAQKASFYFTTTAHQERGKQAPNALYSPPPLSAASSTSSSLPSPKAYPYPPVRVGPYARDSHHLTYPSHHPQHKHTGKLRHSPLQHEQQQQQQQSQHPRYHSKGPVDADQWHTSPPPVRSVHDYGRSSISSNRGRDMITDTNKKSSTSVGSVASPSNLSVSPQITHLASLATATSQKATATTTASTANTRHSPSAASQPRVSSSSSTSSSSPSVACEPVTPLLAFGQHPQHQQQPHRLSYHHHSSSRSTASSDANRIRRQGDATRYSDSEIMDEPPSKRYHHQYHPQHRYSDEPPSRTSPHLSMARMSMKDCHPSSRTNSPTLSTNSAPESSVLPSLSFTSTSSASAASVAVTASGAAAAAAAATTTTALSFSKENSVLSFTKGSTTAEARQQQRLPSQALCQTPAAAAAPAPAPPARESRYPIQLPFRDCTQSHTTTTATTPAQAHQQHQAEVKGLIRSSSDYTQDRKRVKQGMRYSCLVPGCRLQFQNKNQLDSHIWVCREVNKNKIATGDDPDVVMTITGSVKTKKEEEDDVMRFRNDSINRARSNNNVRTDGGLGRASSDEGESKSGSGETSVYPCSEPDCKAVYTSLESLARHRYRHTSVTTGGKLPCTWPGCDKILATTKSLKDHLQIHAERDAGIQLECPVPGCGKIFGTHRCLRAHELRCKQVKSGERLPCPIEGCKATFGSTDYVRRHVLDHEKGLIGVEFRCDFPGCTSILANPLTLQRHKQLHEEQALGFEWKCLVDGCGKVYSGSKQLTDHQSRIHKDLSPLYQFACPYNQCREMFDCQRSAYKHGCLDQRLQSQPPSSSSVDAPAGTAVSASVPSAPAASAASALSVSSPLPSSLSLARVRTSRLPLKIPCTIEGCISWLKGPEELESHLWMHNTLKTRPPYPCFEEGCSMVFDNKQDILSHTLTHSDAA
ncbi:hypothetical protein K457DRAFT_22939 [Linnemannia elongata AG-77]|uniref:C2H2-type domain-containing protein n=1 Tax=Linnemannia elongata AG-77 TaxID=1314771 RepID=A0A197JMU7_9FUNG|nr:hypothetical protein K457DRAFT_22939 [Linnemannia elongata AG-77]